MAAPTLRLNDGRSIPQIGFGTAGLNDTDVAPLIVAAVEAGYRHIDTAARYGNEVGVGQGIRDSGIAREELFVTTKLDGPFQGNDLAVSGLDECLERLGLAYVDLLLIHWPLPQRDLYISTWKTFEKLREAGKTRSIGVSNFKPSHLARLATETSVVPATNQIQLNPRITRPEQRAYDTAHDIITVSWSPLGPRTDLLQDPTLVALANKHGKSPAQIVLRWHTQLGLVAIPRSSNPARIKQNIEIFDFALSDADLAAITALDDGSAPRVDSDTSGH